MFCLECIRSWRSSIDRPREVVRSCPICRTESYYVVPSDYVPGERNFLFVSFLYFRCRSFLLLCLEHEGKIRLRRFWVASLFFLMLICSPWPDSSDEAEKEAIIQTYQTKLTNIPCRYFRAADGDSSCPFGNSCFYAHLNEKGERVKDSTRKYVNADGEVDIIKAVRLSEFIWE